MSIPEQNPFKYLVTPSEEEPLGMRAFDAAVAFTKQSPSSVIDALLGTTVFIKEWEGRVQETIADHSGDDQEALASAIEQRISIEDRLTQIRQELFSLSSQVSEVVVDINNTVNIYKELIPREEKKPSGY